MVRRLEKIEKEMGYCDVKLEKERRLRRQIEFLTAEIEALDKFMKLYESSGMNLQNLPFEKIAQQISIERARRDKVGPFFQRAKEDFVSAGIVEMLRNERDILRRERESIGTKLSSFVGFGKKRTALEEERRRTLGGLADAQSSRLQKLAEAFAQVEGRWNCLTEDALNLDEGIFYLVRNVDYVKSCKAFLISAKGGFEIESWIESRYAGDIFRHSNIGRAREMIDGANRNLKLAQKELSCVATFACKVPNFEPTLVAFLEALFDDIFGEARLVRSVEVVEEALERSEKVLEKVRSKRETLHAKLERIERTRSQLFQRIGNEKRGKVSTN